MSRIFNRFERVLGGPLSGAVVMLGLCAGAAMGQVRVSGLEHTPLGGATFDPPVERRLPVRNLGSSGEDGVEVRLNSRWGGALSIDLDELLIPSPAAREIRIRPRGWDGTVKGNLRVASRPPDGTPGSSLDLDCDFADVGATTVRARVRDVFGNVVLNQVVGGSSLQCVVTLSPPAGVAPQCRVAIKTRGTGADKNVAIATFPNEPVVVSGLGSTPLHEVSSIEVSPETCSSCDTWLGTESMMVTGSGVSQCVVSDADVGTFAVSSHAVGGAFVDEECANPADCDNVRRLVVSNIGSSGQDGVEVDFDDDGVGGSISLRKRELMGHVILMKAFDDAGHEVSRVSHGEDPLGGGNVLMCDATASGATAIDVQLHDSSGAVVHSSREFTAVLAMACSGGPPGSERDMRVACYHGIWIIDGTPPDIYTLPSGTSVPNVATIRLRPVDASGVGASVHSMQLLANAAAGPIQIWPVNDPPSVVRLGGIQGVAMDKGLIAEQPDGSVIVSTPCCDDDNDGLDDGLELRTTSATGGTVTVDGAPLLAAAADGEIKIKIRGWDGTIKGNLRMGGGGGGGAGGIIGLDCDFAGMGAVQVQWAALNVEGEVLATGTAVGSTLGGITVAPEPDGALLLPVLFKVREKANKMVCAMVMTDDDCDVTGLTPDTLHAVRAIEFTPVEPAGSPPWADLDAMQVTFSGIPSLHVLDASLLTFGAQVSGHGIRDIQVGEVCDDGNQCESSRKLRVENIGSSGQDGVELRFGNPLVNEVVIGMDGASMSVARGNCCRGHVIIMKAFDDEGQEAMRMTQSSDEGGTLHTMEFDASSSGATSVSVTLRDQFGNVMHTHEFAGSSGSISYVGPCDASGERAVSADSGGMCAQLCDGPVTVHIDFLDLADVEDVCWDLSIAPGDSRPVHGLEITGSPTDFLEISSFAVMGGEPPCSADYDGNGTREVLDIFAFLTDWFNGVPAAYNFGGTPGVPAIFAFLTEWFAGCP